MKQFYSIKINVLACYMVMISFAGLTNASASNAASFFTSTDAASYTITTKAYTAVSGTIVGGGVTHCSTTNSTTLSIINYNGNFVTWQKAGKINGNYTNIVTAGIFSYTVTNLAKTTWYRAIVSDGYSTATTAPVCIIIMSHLKQGKITAPLNVCEGAPITMTLTGYLGAAFQWQSAPDSGSTFVDIPGATATTYTIPTADIAMDKAYRVIVYNACLTNSTVTTTKLVKVDPASVAGTITGGGVVASGGSAVPKLNNYTGKIQWQYSTDGNSFADAPNAASQLPGQVFSTTSPTATGTTYQVTNILGTVYFRTRVTSGACSTAYSDPVQYVVGTGAAVGTVSAQSNAVCPGSATTLTLTDAIGTVTWQKCTNYLTASPTWSTLNNHGLSFTTPNLTVDTVFRAMVTLGNNSTVYSNEVPVSVTATPVAKPVYTNITYPMGDSALTALCTTDASKMLIMAAGSVGALQWEVSTTSASSDYVAVANGDRSVYTVDSPAAGTHYYRVKVDTGCATPVYSNVVSVYYQDCNASGGKPATRTETKELTVSAYPNPFSNDFQLKIASSSDAEVTVMVYDLMGRLMDKHQGSSYDLSNDAIGGHFPTGIYTVVITQGDTTKTTRVAKR